MFFRFFNKMITSPGEFKIVEELNINQTMSLISVSKILQAVFDLRTFEDNTTLSFANDFITENIPRITSYYKTLISVPEPEDYLQISRYNEFTTKNQPFIIISLKEISKIHQLLATHIDHIERTNNEKDLLRIILGELGNVPVISDNNRKEIQLNLQNRYDNNQGTQSVDLESQFTATKALILTIFKAVPIDKSHPLTLMGVLEFAKQYATEKQNNTVVQNVDKAIANLKHLDDEKHPKVHGDERYTQVLKEIAIEVINRKQIKEGQRKEIARMEAALKNLKHHQKFVEEQINDFNNYLGSCRENLAKKSKLPKKPVKFAHKDLVKKNVILHSDVPTISRSKCRFFISMSEDRTTVKIECKIQGISVDTLEINLEDLLEKKDNGVVKYDLGKVVLHVASTISLINSTFLS